jgi:hypothetical protein
MLILKFEGWFMITYRKWKNVNNREGYALEKEKHPYNLVDTEVLGCMRACNIFSLGEMMGHINVIFLHPLFPIPNPFSLTYDPVLVILMFMCGI